MLGICCSLLGNVLGSVDNRITWNLQMDILKRWTLPLGVILCGTVLAPFALDKAEPIRHIIWCLMAIALVLQTKTLKVYPFALGFLFFTLLSGMFAVNKSEWLFWSLRLSLAIIFLSSLEIDEKLLAKAIMILGVIFLAHFLFECVTCKGFIYHRGLMCQRNTWAASMFFIIPFCWYAKDKFWKKTAWAIMVAMAVCIVCLQSRCAILALFVAGVIVVNNKIRILLLIVAGIVLSQYDTATLNHRFEQWYYTLNMIKDYPLGVGAGNWWILFPHYAVGIDYPGSFFKEAYRFPHNDFVWVCAEIGILGLLCYIGMFIKGLWKAEKWRVMGLMGYITMACFTTLRERPFTSLMLFVLLAVGGKVYPQPRILLTVLIFALVVFGFRLNSSYWDKKLGRAKTVPKLIESARGYSVFSTMTYTGMPWKYWEALEHPYLYKEALRCNPYNVHVLNQAGMVYGNEKDFEKAKECFSEAIRICPDFTAARENLERLNKRYPKCQ